MGRKGEKRKPKRNRPIIPGNTGGNEIQIQSVCVGGVGSVGNTAISGDDH